MKRSLGGDGGATDSGTDMDGRGPIDRRGGWGGKMMTWGGEAVAGRETERGGVGIAAFLQRVSSVGHNVTTV